MKNNKRIKTELQVCKEKHSKIPRTESFISLFINTVKHLALTFALCGTIQKEVEVQLSDTYLFSF